MPEIGYFGKGKGPCVRIGDCQKICTGLFSLYIARNQIEERHPLNFFIEQFIIWQKGKRSLIDFKYVAMINIHDIGFFG